jgi:hypothetical protein
MMPLSNAEQIVIVIAGAVLTLLLGGALLYWIDQEWRTLDARPRAGSDTSERRSIERQSRPPPSDPSSES